MNDFSGIKDWQQFEHLVEDYFAGIHLDTRNSIESVDTKPSGKGPDGGIDLLVTFKFKGAITEFERKLVVQCKFQNKTVGLSQIANVNIPTLIHSYKADSYLLICKNDFSAGISNLFERLNNDSLFGYKYYHWNGANFIRLIVDRDDLMKRYFPKYYSGK